MNVLEVEPGLLADIEDLAIDLARAAGSIIREQYRQQIEIEFKDKEHRDPVTEVDRAVENLIRERVGQTFPEHGILGEETETPATVSDFLWVIDPLDGTTNFVSGVPGFGASIGVLYRSTPVVGAIYLPISPDLGPAVLHARRGGGAWLNDRRLDLESERESRLAGAPPSFRRMFRVDPSVGKLVVDTRSLGSIAYELALSATGGLRFVIFGGPKLWDVAAGAVIVKEAGGLVYTWNGQAWASLERFEPPAESRSRRKAKTPSVAVDPLRRWSAPLIAGRADCVQVIAKSLRPRRRLPRIVRRALRFIRQGLARKQVGQS